MKSKDKKNPDSRVENPYANNRKTVEDINEKERPTPGSKLVKRNIKQKEREVRNTKTEA
jgi:hypothetical protein